MIEPNGTLERIAAFHHSMAAATPQLARLQSGFLIREMLERFSMKIKSTLKPDRSLWFYSAHETTMANLLNSLEMFEVFSLLKKSTKLLKMTENIYF